MTSRTSKSEGDSVGAKTLFRAEVHKYKKKRSATFQNFDVGLKLPYLQMDPIVDDLNKIVKETKMVNANKQLSYLRSLKPLNNQLNKMYCLAVKYILLLCQGEEKGICVRYPKVSGIDCNQPSPFITALSKSTKSTREKNKRVKNN